MHARSKNVLQPSSDRKQAALGLRTSYRGWHAQTGILAYFNAHRHSAQRATPACGKGAHSTVAEQNLREVEAAVQEGT